MTDFYNLFTLKKQNEIINLDEVSYASWLSEDEKNDKLKIKIVFRSGTTEIIEFDQLGWDDLSRVLLEKIKKYNK